jgi:hypothetical protein
VATAIPVDNAVNAPIWEGNFPVMSSFVEQRRARRFSLQLPLAFTPAGGARPPFGGVTTNISSRGVLFTADQEAGRGTPIEYIVTLNTTGEHPVNLRCMGKVLRAEPADGAYQIAATLERYEFVR